MSGELTRQIDIFTVNLSCYNQQLNDGYDHQRKVLIEFSMGLGTIFQLLYF